MSESEVQQPVAADCEAADDEAAACDTAEYDTTRSDAELASSLANNQLEVALATAERKLAEALLQIAELEGLLEEVPAIFERKFAQRLQPVLERQDQLLADNRELRRQIKQLAPVPGEVRLRFNPAAETGVGEGLLLPRLPERSRVPQADLQRGGQRRRRAA